MKALTLNGYGGNSKLELRDVPAPEAAAGEVLIRVRYAGLNPLDYKIRDGALKAIRPLRFPHVLGNEVAGVVEEVGPGVTAFRPGDEVFCRLDKDRMGAFAELVAERVAFVAPKPRSLSQEIAGGVPLAALTAWQCLFELGGVGPGKRILIHGGAGAVGRIAVQLARNAGAFTAATVSDRGVELMKELGVDRIVNYRREKFEAHGRDYDVVLDLVGGETLDRSFGVVKGGGTVISIAGPPEPSVAKSLGKGLGFALIFRALARKPLRLAKEAGATYRFLFMRPDGEQLARIGALIEAGELKVGIDRVFALEDFEAAFTYQESGRALGKVVFRI